MSKVTEHGEVIYSAEEVAEMSKAFDYLIRWIESEERMTDAIVKIANRLSRVYKPDFHYQYNQHQALQV